jgi:uncharacterized protein
MSAARRRAHRRLGLALPLLLALALAAAAADAVPDAQGLQPTPKLSARVTDLTGTLTAEQQTALEQKLAAFEAAKGSQLAVLMVPTTEPEDIFQYSFRVADQWKLGRRTVDGRRVDDGALLVIAKNDRHVWIQVGYGLEGVLTDAVCRRIVDETITPEFRQGNFYGGIDAGLDRMMRLVQGEALPPPEQGWQSGRALGHHASLFPELLFAVLVGSVVLRGIFGRTLGSVFTAAGAAALAWVGGLALVLVVLSAVAGFAFSMLGGLARGSGWSSGLGGGWGGFGGGIGGGFGAGGFGGGGGFSGGGGGFGGGGAGGSW